jgi:hypothetical protein
MLIDLLQQLEQAERSVFTLTDEAFKLWLVGSGDEQRMMAARDKACGNIALMRHLLIGEAYDQGKLVVKNST